MLVYRSVSYHKTPNGTEVDFVLIFFWIFLMKWLEFFKYLGQFIATIRLRRRLRIPSEKHGWFSGNQGIGIPSRMHERNSFRFLGIIYLLVNLFLKHPQTFHPQNFISAQFYRPFHPNYIGNRIHFTPNCFCLKEDGGCYTLENLEDEFPFQRGDF